MILEFIKMPVVGWILLDNRGKHIDGVYDDSGKLKMAREILVECLDKLKDKVNLEVIYKIKIDVSDNVRILEVR